MPSNTPAARAIRGIALALVAVVAVTIVAVFFLSSGDDGSRPLPARVDPMLPDLTVAPLTGIVGGLNEDGTRTVRFGVMIVNKGAGDFVLRARRSSVLADDWRVIQRVSEPGGGYTETASPATLIYGGDGHDHWHIREVESHTIETLDGTVVGHVVKSGFCFFDTNLVHPELPGTPDTGVYVSAGCGGRIDSAATMGLSVGWGDEYPWHLFEQEIDITALDEGRYRLRAVVDPLGWFDEYDDANNEVSVDIEWHLQDGIPAVEVVPSPSPSVGLANPR